MPLSSSGSAGDVAMGVPVQLGASPQVLPLPAGDARSESTRSKSSIESEVEEGIVDEVEMLLEAYFMQASKQLPYACDSCRCHAGLLVCESADEDG